jgi:rhodanese-related sulfurtransferase
MVEAALKSVNLIEPADLNNLMEEYATYTLIDVRQELEHYYGFIPGTVNIPRGSLEFNIDNDTFWEETGLYEPMRDELIILYCQKGQRSILAAESLKKLGYSNIKVLTGGWKNWELTYPDIYEKNLDKLSGKDDKPSGGGSC